MKVLKNLNYHIPSSVQEAIALISKEENVGIVAGNTLLNELGKRGFLEDLTSLVDITQLPLNYVVEERTAIRIGALTTFSNLLKETFLNRRAYASLRQALSSVRPTQIRNAATLGGCVAAGLPFLDVPVALLCLNARLRIADKRGEQTVAYSDLCSEISGGIQSGRLILEAKIPSYDVSVRSHYSRFSTTGLGEAIVNVATRVVMDKQDRNKCSEASIAVGGAGFDLGRMREAENLMINKELGERLFEEVVESIVKSASIISDINASADYKRQILAVQLRRLLNEIARE